VTRPIARIIATLATLALGGCTSTSGTETEQGGASGSLSAGGSSGTGGTQGKAGAGAGGSPGGSPGGSQGSPVGGQSGTATGGMAQTGGRTSSAGGQAGSVTTGGGGTAMGGATGGGIAGTSAGGSGAGGSLQTGGARGDAAADIPDASVGTSDAQPARDGQSPDRPSDGGQPSSGIFKPPFILGADITITVEDEYWGATYTDDGQQKSIEQLLKDHGFNFIRISTFVDPSASDGYASDKPEAFRDLAHTITLAKRVKKIGLGFLLDFHYSDTWASPSAQATPKAWAGLSLSTLATKLHDYTKEAVTQLKSQGAMPDMVQVGNEITNGMLWDSGSISNSSFTSFATLLKAGTQAVREVDPNIVIVMHIEKCNNFTTSKWWLDGVIGQGVSFDVLGQSCYATAPNGVAGFHGTPADWKTTFKQLADAYPSLKFIIAEYSAEQRAAGDVMFGMPDKRGLGTFNWDPTRSYETLPNDPLFSTDGAWNRFVAIPAKMALYEQMAKDFGLTSSPAGSQP
jgi:arabinogalactan endo-1,4-beta-galactosidase